MSSKYTAGAEALDRLAVQFKALTDLAEVLRAAGSMEQAAKEAQARYDKATTDERELQDQVAGLRVYAQQIRADAAAALAEAGDRVRELLAQAESQAKAIVADAQLKAQSLTAAVQNEIDGKHAAAQASIDEAETAAREAIEELAAIERQVKIASETLQALEDKTTELKKSLAELAKG